MPMLHTMIEDCAMKRGIKQHNSSYGVFINLSFKEDPRKRAKETCLDENGQRINVQDHSKMTEQMVQKQILRGHQTC